MRKLKLTPKRVPQSREVKIKITVDSTSLDEAIIKSDKLIKSLNELKKLLK